MELLNSEYYHQIKINLSYDDHYLEEENDNQKKINDLLLAWLKKEKPYSYRLLNAQTLFIDQVERYGRVWSPIVQHILHISFVKNKS